MVHMLFVHNYYYILLLGQGIVRKTVLWFTTWCVSQCQDMVWYSNYEDVISQSTPIYISIILLCFVYLHVKCTYILSGIVNMLTNQTLDKQLSLLHIENGSTGI